MTTITPSTPALVKVGVTATVRMIRRDQEAVVDSIGAAAGLALA
jgi:hypothetical protein